MLLSLLATLLTNPVDFQPVEDTYIDSTVPDGNFGRDPILFSGPGSVILVRFPGLSWIPSSQEIDDATLELTMADDSDVKLKSVRRATAEWGEGAGLRAPFVQAKADELAKGGATWNSARSGEAKWQKAGCSGESDSAALDGVTAERDGQIVRIKGLGPALRSMAQDPDHDFGLRIEFETKDAFYSFEGAGAGPRLVLKTKTATNTGARLKVLSIDHDSGNVWVAHVQNVGGAPATGWHAAWSYKGVSAGDSDSQQALAPGDTVEIKATVGGKPVAGEPARNSISLTVEPGGQSSGSESRSYLSVPETGLPVRFSLDEATRTAVDKDRGDEPLLVYFQRIVSCVNRGVFAQSRASFSPLGCKERLRVTTGSDPAIEVTGGLDGTSSVFGSLVRDVVRAVSPYSSKWATPPETAAWPEMSLGWIPDTRDETAWPTTLMLPSFPWAEPKPMQSPLPARGLLGRAEIAAINELIEKPLEDRAKFVPALPRLTLLMAEDCNRQPIADASIEVFPEVDGKLSTTAAYKVKTNANGFAMLSKSNGPGLFSDLKSDGSNCWCYVRITREDVTDNAWLPAYQLASEAARGNLGAPVITMQFVLPSAPLRTNEDLAQGKIVTDSLNRFPAELNALVDGDAKTSLTIDPSEKPYWVEIDLGRDRLIGGVEIETTGGIWDQFQIKIAKTGEKGAMGESWVREAAGGLRMLERGQGAEGHKVITYASAAVRGRYVRLEVPAGQKIDVAAIRVLTVEQ